MAPTWPYSNCGVALSAYCCQRHFAQQHAEKAHSPYTTCSWPTQSQAAVAACKGAASPFTYLRRLARRSYAPQLRALRLSLSLPDPLGPLYPCQGLCSGPDQDDVPVLVTCLHLSRDQGGLCACPAGALGESPPRSGVHNVLSQDTVRLRASPWRQSGRLAPACFEGPVR